MPPPCKVCRHPQRDLIDEALAAGMSNREAAARWGCSKDGIGRHRANHVSAAVQVTAAPTTEDAGTALARLEHLFLRVERVLTAAERSGDLKDTIAASRELRQVTEVVARIRGELDERTQVQVLNVSTDPQWLATRAAMLEALRPYPEAATAVASRLLALEQAHAGD